MKKLLVVIVTIMFVAFSSQMVDGQEVRQSCVKHDSSRTIEGFKQVILTWKDPFIQNELWPEYARLANKILATSTSEEVRGTIVTPDFKGMTWLMNHTVEYENSYFNQSDYHNGVRINNDLVYRDIAGNPSNWAVLEYKDVSGMYAKIACCNSEDKKVEVVKVALAPPPPPAPAPTPAPVQRVDTVKTVYITEYREVQQQMAPQQPIQYGYRESRVSINVGMQRPMYYPQQRMQMRQPMAYRPMQRSYCPPQRQYRPQPRPQRPVYEDRTMPGGLPSINQPTYTQPTYNPGSGGGVPSEDRRMPNGIQSRSMAR